MRLLIVFLAIACSAIARPNILFIMSDDHASHAISAYGSRINQTPNIDRIAEGGMRFNNCFCTNSICGPSRAVIQTGKHSHKNGFMNNGDKFDWNQQTFPKLLQAVGYQTAIYGKSHTVKKAVSSNAVGLIYGSKGDMSRRKHRRARKTS